MVTGAMASLRFVLGARPMSRERWHEIAGFAAVVLLVCAFLLIVALGLACQFLVECL
jgi:hypothetical protein